jgi:hypothetical protein
MSRSVAIVLMFGAVTGCAGNEDCASDLQTDCDGTCVFLSSDPDNCGTCGVVCPGGACTDGRCEDAPPFDAGMTTGDCSPSCASTHICCGRTCVPREQPRNVDGRPGNPDDPTSAFNNCGFCGNRCNAMEAISCSVRSSGGMADCLCGDDECLPGDTCVATGGAYQCTNLSTDPQNCGTPGRVCGTGETCSAGVCGCGGAGPCDAGESCCSGSCIDTMGDDAMNCGGCGMACPPEGPTCTAGSCGCGASGEMCDPPTPGGIMGGGDPGELCCDGACVAQDVMNCGGCGTACDTSDPEEPEMCAQGLPPPLGMGGVCCSTEEFCIDFPFP